MKESELRKHAKCTGCGKKIMESGIPLFYTLKIERWGVDVSACRRQDGLAAFLGGNPYLAGVMGDDRDLAKPMMDPVTVTICEACSTEPKIIACLAERGSEVAA